MSTTREGLMRPFISVEVEARQPMAGRSKAYFRPFMGRLQAAMYRAGVVHHFRMVDADKVMWLVPPAWLPPHSLQVAEMAMDRLDARFLHILQTVPHDVVWSVLRQVTGTPEDLSDKEAVAWINRQKMELVH